MTKSILGAIVALVLAACQSTGTYAVNHGGGGSAPDMDRLRSVETTATETVRPDTTPNDSGQQGTDGGHNSSDVDQPGKPDKISG